MLVSGRSYGVEFRRNTDTDRTSGMANRLAFDIGLHIECSAVGLSERETSIRERVMKACILYDRYWALFLGRPTSIKSRDVNLDFITKRRSSIGCSILDSGPPTDTQAREEEIHEQLLELMDLAGEIVETQNDVRPGLNTTEKPGNSAYMRVLTIDQQLRGWYARLPDHLTWKVVNTRAAPFSYFLLHQQYNATMILLHRSWEYDRWASEDESANTETASEMRPPSISDEMSDSDGRKSPALDNRSPLARSVCTQAAIQFAQVLSQCKQRYNMEKMGFTSLQSAGAASTAFLAAIAYSKDETDRRSYLSYLGVVTDAIRSMSHSYQPAIRMDSLIQIVLSQLHLHTREARDAHRTLFGQATKDLKSREQYQSKGSEQFTLLPVRREYSDKDQVLGNSNKRPRTTSFHHDSRPAPTFNMPPSPSMAIHPPTTLPSHHHSNSASGLLPTFSDPPSEFFNLDSLRSLAMGGDPTYGDRRFTTHNLSDNYLRVAPSAEGWGLHSLHAASTPEDPVPSFDSHMLDWVGGGGGVGSATTTFHQSALSAKNTTAPGITSSSSTMLNNNNSNTSAGSNIDNMDSEGLMICKTEEAGSLAWISSETEFDALTPVSLRSSHSHVGDKADPTVPPRNHELDFLSF
jgi:hypothetical protein